MAHYSVAGTPRQSARARGGTAASAPQRSVKMEYRGVKYSVVQGTSPNVWRWRVVVGKPEMLRLGDAASELHAKAQVHKVIDRALALQEALRSSGKSK
jgi:hypothetical protein